MEERRRHLNFSSIFLCMFNPFFNDHVVLRTSVLCISSCVCVLSFTCIYQAKVQGMYVFS